LDNDTELDCGVIAIFQVQDKDYIALYPLNESDEKVFLYRLNHTGDNDLNLENIDDDEEYDIVANAYKLVDDEVNKI
jgi:uncharacterized protein YrzB (UPF0473 family)